MTLNAFYLGSGYELEQGIYRYEIRAIAELRR
jgi:hypothetical protein